MAEFPESISEHEVDLALEAFPELTDNPEAFIIDGMPKLKSIIQTMYEELVLRSTTPRVWSNEIVRNPVFAVQAQKIAELFQEVLDTKYVFVLRTGNKESWHLPAEFTRKEKIPDGTHSYEVVDELAENSDFPVVDNTAKYLIIGAGGSIHLTVVGQVLHQGGDLVLVPKDSLPE